jgi:hypothetical protein
MIEVIKYIEPYYLATFIVLSYGLREVTGEVLRFFFGVERPRVYAVFIIAILVGVPYYFAGAQSEPGWDVFNRLLLTYAVGTSFYELIIKAIIDKVKNIK